MAVTSSSMLDVLRVIRPHIAEELIPRHHYRLIESLASRLVPMDWGGFECPLDPGRNPADFHLGLTDHRDGLFMADKGIPEDRIRAHDGWGRIRDLCRQWGERSTPALDVINRIGLEFDVLSTREDVPSPSVFWSFRHPRDGILDHDSQLEAILSAVAILSDKKNTSFLDSELAGIQRSLPQSATILHAGVMLARSDSPLRVNIWGLEFSAIPTFLEQTGNGQLNDELAPLIEGLSGLVNSIVVGIDIGPTASGHIGLECAAVRKADGNLDWRSLLNAFGDLNLCTASQRDSVLAWPGGDDPVSSSVPWPDQFIIRSLQQSPKQMSTLIRSISHIKVALPEKGVYQAKVYLEFSHSWLDLE